MIGKWEGEKEEETNSSVTRPTTRYGKWKREESGRQKMLRPPPPHPSSNVSFSTSEIKELVHTLGT